MITQLRRDYSKEKYCNPRSEQHQTSMVTNSLPHSLTHSPLSHSLLPELRCVILMTSW